MKKKTFDCVAMKRRGAEKIYKQIAGMTPEEQLAFWSARTEILRKRQQVIRKHEESNALGRTSQKTARTRGNG